MDQEQQQRLKDAVERNARASEAGSRSTRHSRADLEGGDSQGDQESLRSQSQPQDTFSPREENNRHRKLTTDNWNQRAAGCLSRSS